MLTSVEHTVSTYTCGRLVAVERANAAFKCDGIVQLERFERGVGGRRRSRRSAPARALFLTL
jgi:hypothetical protein